jgi:hypothetical protein
MSDIDDSVPLLYTSKGNIPIDGLELKTLWNFEETGITFTEEYWQGDECVKRSAHRFQYPQGTTLNLTQGDFINGSGNQH